MAIHEQNAEDLRKTRRRQANLGQKKAAREKASDAKLDHMGETSSLKVGDKKERRERK